MKLISWWCPKCKQPVGNTKPCPRCGAERVSSWRCDQCQTIVVDKNACPVCGRKRATVIYNRLLVSKLFEETGPGGHTNVEILRRYAYKYAYTRNIPDYLVEDALSATFEKLVTNYKNFDPDKGKFRTWAITILRNEIANAARESVKEAKKIGIRLDQSGGRDDDSLTMEHVLGYTFGAEDLIKAEEKKRFVIMAALARKAFGNYSTVIRGDPVVLSIYDLCVEKYQQRDGQGWLSMAAREAGLSKQALSMRQDKARRTWVSWNLAKKEDA